MNGYNPSTIEPKWQAYWRANGTTSVQYDTSRPKYYVLDMFPYPSGTGLHIGHPEGYTATDIVSRFKRMCGFNVLHPMGFDAFGLPTERQAMKENIHPRIITERNIATFRRQLEAIGFDYDWSSSVNTTDPSYVKWTQWMFLLIYNSWYDTSANRARPISELPIPENITAPQDVELFRDAHRLAYVANIPVNWCEALGTVLANEEVDEWKAKGYSVERRPMRQWMIRITAYAERLLADLDDLQWPSSTLDMQRHWIGRSDGARVRFDVADSNHSITVFTTRPDTIFGATYLVLAPEHPLVDDITTTSHAADVASYKEAASLKSDLERTELSKDKSGVFTGAYAVNPASGQPVPIWIADYVLAHYGTGAIMAVPGHDERDFDFAIRYGLPILQVVSPADGSVIDVSTKPFSDPGVSVNSTSDFVSITGLESATAKQTIIAWLESSERGRGTIQYRLRDWLFSRQRYWGEPIPIIFFDDGTRRAMDLDELPLQLPNVDNFQPAGTGESPLATVETWTNYLDSKTGKRGRLETNTMPQWAGSCWYYLRYADPSNDSWFVDPAREQYWMGTEGVDLYMGGAEHSVLHLLYARFWHKVLFDYGYVSSKEPFKRLFHQGLILGEDGRKMSKSLGNTINPDDVIASHGADALRLYEMFLGPLEASKPWNTNGIEGIVRFLQRTWRLIASEDGQCSPTVQDIPCTPEQDFVLHTTIKKTRADIDALSFNTAIAQFMIFVNEFTSAPVRPRIAMEQFVQCLAPFAPHIAEELWSILGHTQSVFATTFPAVDESKLVQATVEIVLQVNSKVRGKAIVAADADDDHLVATALADENVQRFIEGKAVRKTIVVPGKLVNLIVG
ncbi:MAG: leucine--tRNA ligase [Candidatus Kapabacteria bacterium]|nr:leucine--tRNA ligase [Candidatus Kapabacteria bacterium]